MTVHPSTINDDPIRKQRRLRGDETPLLRATRTSGRAHMRSRMMRREPEGQSAPRPADKALMARGGVLRRLRYTFLAAGTGLAAVGTLGGFTVPAQAASFPGA